MAASSGPLRVAGADPGTSSLDLLILEEGTVHDQCRFTPDQLHDDATLPVQWLEQRGPLALIAGPSGYGLPLIWARDASEHDLNLMSLTRPDERGQGQGVIGFRSLVQALCASSLPTLFLPGVIHLPSVPTHRKFNRIDLGTPDKLCVAALALRQQTASNGGAFSQCTFCVVELGTVFSACLVVSGGQIVDGLGGTSGPVGWGSSGAWDGETAYVLSPLSKRDLFVGGAATCDVAEGQTWFCESILKAVAGLQSSTSFEQIVLSGRLLEQETDLGNRLTIELQRLGQVHRLEPLPGAWVKHAAQGAALLADGVAGGQYRGLLDSLQLGEASGTILDWLRHPGADAVRSQWLK